MHTSAHRFLNLASPCSAIREVRSGAGAQLVLCARGATDNEAARHLSYNPEQHNKTKHIQRRHFFVRDMVEAFEIRVPRVATKDNWADFFTKPLASKEFMALRALIMNEPHVHDPESDESRGESLQRPTSVRGGASKRAGA